MIPCKLNDLRNEFLNLAGELAQKLSAPTNKLDRKDVFYALERTICDEEALWLLRNRYSRAESRIDGYWISKHEYTKQKIIEKLANRFHDLHIPVEIASESQGPNARQDILVRVKKPDGSAKKRIALEIKTGYRLDFCQLERLMWDNDTVVLVRAETGHVTVLRSHKYVAMLAESLRNKIGRVRRLIEGHGHMIQDRNCSRCSNEGCPLIRRRATYLVALRDDEFDMDLDAFLRTLPSTIDKAVESVMHEC